MRKIKFYIVDVFASHKYEGNQLAVFVDSENQLSPNVMKTIAKEINFAETSFIKENKDDNRFVVKIFTPEHEVPFAGHPSIGTSFIISKFLLPEPKRKLILELAHSDIEISVLQPENIDKSILFMKQSQPEFRETFTHHEVSTELGIDICHLDNSLPIQEISTGLPYIIIPVKNLDAIEKIDLQYSSFQKFLEVRKKYKTNSITGHSTSLFFFTRETYEKENSFNTRMLLLENNKLSEDAATGSANGCLLAYLLRYHDKKITATVEQGLQMGRRSYLYLEGESKNGKYAINIGGQTKLVSEGVWHL
ncbi:MAG: PhzF family phenazine biosynthesis protein [Bacteroidetes bacterium]|nr:PhzF family phenazine biosynthesis protein [Bacteroidota bacterium]